MLICHICVFLMCFVCSNMGVRKFKKCSKVFLIYFGLTLLAILVHLLLNDSGFKNLARFFQYTHSDASKLYTFTTWLNALTLVVIARGVGDGTLHALGSMNPFKTDSQVISWWISIFSFGTIVVATFLFGYMEITGSDRYFMDIGIMARQKVHRDVMPILKRKVSFIALFYNYSYTNLWAKFVLFIFYIAAIIGQIANHVLMAENFYTTVLNWFPQLTKINVKVLKHCLYAVYYVVIGWIYYFLQFDLVEYADEAYHLMRCVLLASVFWECVAVAKFYSMRRFLVNIRFTIAHVVGDGLLHVLGSTNLFKADSQVWSWCVSVLKSCSMYIFGVFLSSLGVCNMVVKSGKLGITLFIMMCVCIPGATAQKGTESPKNSGPLPTQAQMCLYEFMLIPAFCILVGTVVLPISLLLMIVVVNYREGKSDWNNVFWLFYLLRKDGREPRTSFAVWNPPLWVVREWNIILIDQENFDRISEWWAYGS